MKLNIGAIMSPPAKQFLEQILPEISTNCNITILEAATMDEAREIFEHRAKEFDAVVFSGIIFMVYATKNIYVTKTPCYSFEDMSPDFTSTFYKILLNNRNFDFSRASIDGIISKMDPLGFKNLFPTNQMPYIMDDKFDSFFDMDDVVGMELTDNVLDWHTSLYNTGKIDLVITRYGAITKELENRKIPYVYATPTKEYAINFFMQIINSVNMKFVRDQMIGIISIRFRVDNEILNDEYTVKFSELFSKFAGERGYDFSFNKNLDRLEILTRYKELALITNEFTAMPMISELDEAMSKCIIVGIGTGTTPFQARANSSNALLISGTKRETYYVSYDNKVTGPLGEGKQNYELTPYARVLELAKRYGVDHIVIQQVISFMNISEKKVITAQELADFMSVSRRTANRILTKISAANGATIYEENVGGGKGRPILKYEMLFG